MLIFGIMAMMLVFQYSGKIMNDNGGRVAYQSALPANAVILSMQIDNLLIRRVGAGLETQPELGLSQDKLKQIIAAWEGATFEPVDSSVKIDNTDYGIQIVFEVANLAAPITLILYQIESGYLLQNWQDQLLQMSDAELQVLLPR